MFKSSIIGQLRGAINQLGQKHGIVAPTQLIITMELCMSTLPFRQVHLDFHTSPHIPEIGIDFDPAEFVATLKAGHVNSITVFAKCHHGYSYYPTKIGTPHPHLQRPDLLGEMLRACREAGIRAPVYTTVTWDELAWATHPEWRQIAPNGSIAGPSNSPLKPGWKNLCMNSGYGDYVIDQIREIMQMYDVDGFFIDITRYIGAPCVCSTCLAQMQAQGVNPEDPEQLKQFSLEAERRFMDRCTAAIRAIKPVDIFYNSRLRMHGQPERGNRVEMDNFTHIEIESLPGGGWGYDHFPLYVRYFQTFDRPLLAMTGRFHTSWGDFGGVRNRAALELECFSALAHGAAISIGDQLHPRGRLDPAVYQRIGEIFSEVEQREPWCRDSVPLPEIAVLTSSGIASAAGELMHDTDLGVLHILEQLKYQFQFIDTACDLSPYKLLILPDIVEIDQAFADKVRAFVAAGGKLLVSDRAGLDAEGKNFLLADLLGVNYAGPAPFAPDYMLLSEELGAGIEPAAHVCELQGSRVTLAEGSQILARVGEPYFNRTWQHFCSHQYSPFKAASDDALVVQNGPAIYLARPLFTEYAQSARLVHKKLVGNLIARLLDRPRVGKHSLPSTAIVTVRAQGKDTIVHLLHYVHQRRGKVLDIVEDVIPLYNQEIAIRCDAEPSAVQLAPGGESIDWEWRDGYVHLHVPKLNGYQIVHIRA